MEGRTMHMSSTLIALFSVFFFHITQPSVAQETRNGSGALVGVHQGQLWRYGKTYRFVGTNFWYAPILASDGEGGNYQRLCAELDTLNALGINNLRILVGAQGEHPHQSLVWPTLIPEPNVFNDTLLVGLDRLLFELGQRNMTAVLYLNNAWEWSGGYGKYLEWAGQPTAPDPTLDGYHKYVSYVSRFATNERAQQLFLDDVQAIISRTNSVTGLPYSKDKAIMAWQVCNEPRPFSIDSLTIKGFTQWLRATTALIRRLDPNHLISLGSEGRVGCEGELSLYEVLHNDANVDYLTIHVWPMNWGWLTRQQMQADCEGQDSVTMQKVKRLTREYIEEHAAIAERLRKPIVLEEFGYSRDGLSFDLSSTTKARNSYYQFVLDLPHSMPALCGINFWAWSGFAHPSHERWQRGDDYCGDPSQEEQGLFSVFLSDSATIGIIRNAVLGLRSTNHSCNLSDK